MAAPLGGRLCAGTITAVSFKPADSDLGMSGEGSTAAVGYVQFYARTRPISVIRSTELSVRFAGLRTFRSAWRSELLN